MSSAAAAAVSRERPDEQGLVTEARASIDALHAWVDRNGWAGYDPYDVKGTRAFMWALGLSKKTLFHKLFRKAVLGPFIIGESLFPQLTRRLFGVGRSVNAKGMALFAKAYLQLFAVTGEAVFKAKALQCLQWLDTHRSPGYTHACWGYPFNWESGVVVPAWTPASVVSAAACDAYWTAWRVLGDSRYLEVCASTCRFFLDDLRIDEIDAHTVCFSYTPLDDFHVHNTNLLVAELLVRVGKQLGEQRWVETGLRAGNYALRELNPDGSLFYWGRVQDHMNPGRVDHYHSGFEIRCLHAIGKLTGLSAYQGAARRYYEYYARRLVAEQGDEVVVRMYPDTTYPINIHSCAEALLLNAQLAGEHADARARIAPLLRWVNRRMRKSDGSYAYMRKKVLGFDVQIRIPYIRWGQAWMLLALSQVLALSVSRGEVP